MWCEYVDEDTVSTHSRTEAAAEAKNKKAQDILVSTHSRTEAAAFNN